MLRVSTPPQRIMPSVIAPFTVVFDVYKTPTWSRRGGIGSAPWRYIAIQVISEFTTATWAVAQPAMRLDGTSPLRLRRTTVGRACADYREHVGPTDCSCNQANRSRSKLSIPLLPDQLKYRRSIFS
jgi:hypothetical protein